MASDYRGLQQRCRELKKYLPPGARCNESAESLRTYIKTAEELIARTETISRAGLPKDSIPLPDDLLATVATYTEPFTTYEVVTLSGSIAAQALLTHLWREKTLVERFGLVYSNTELAGYEENLFKAWHTYYRGVCGHTWGQAYIKRAKEDQPEQITQIGDPAVTLDSIGKNYFAVGTARKMLIIHEHPGQRRLATFSRVITGPTIHGGDLVIDERGRVTVHHFERGGIRGSRTRLERTEISFDIPVVTGTEVAPERADGSVARVILRDGRVANVYLKPKPAIIPLVPEIRLMNTDDLYLLSEKAPLLRLPLIFDNHRDNLEIFPNGSINNSFGGPIPVCRAWKYHSEIYGLGVDGKVRKYTVKRQGKGPPPAISIEEVPLPGSVKEFITGPSWLGYIL